MLRASLVGVIFGARCSIIRCIPSEVCRRHANIVVYTPLNLHNNQAFTRLTRIEGSHKVMILEVIPHAWQIYGYGDVILIQQKLRSNTRELKQLYRVDSSSSHNNFDISSNSLPRGGFICGKLSGCSVLEK